MAYYVVDGYAVESCDMRWVDNARANLVVTEVVPIKTCDGDAWRMVATDAQVIAAMRAVTLQNEAFGRYRAEHASDSKAI